MHSPTPPNDGPREIDLFDWGSAKPAGPSAPPGTAQEAGPQAPQPLQLMPDPEPPLLSSWWVRLAVCAFVLAALWEAQAASAEPVAAARYTIEQPALPMAQALQAIARRTGSSVLFDPAVVQGLTASPVSGEYSAAEAIARALRGSPLAVEVMRDGSMVVRAAQASGRQGVGVSVVGAAGGLGADGQAVRLAQAQAGVLSDAPPAGTVPAAAGRTVNDRIVITGSRLRRIDAEGAVPINVYRREDIERSGQPSLDRFLATLNEVSLNSGEGFFGALSGQATVQLRGLPIGSTLVLINGRRVQAVGSSSGNLFNLNLIPLAAVERIEVVPVGSSAVYGGDALAGVVNIILRDRLDGLSMTASLTTGRGFSDAGISIAGGMKGERGGLTLLGSVRRNSPLTAAERGFFVDADYTRFGGRDTRSRNCTPGTVSGEGGANLPGLGTPLAGIPARQGNAPLTIADFAGTAGVPNLCSNAGNGNGSALVHGSESAGLHASGHWDFDGAGTVFGEFTFVQDKLRTEEGGLVLNNVLVPAANPYNPFGVPVRVTARLGLENGSEGIERRTDFLRALLGWRGELGRGWDYEASISTSRDEGDRQMLNGTANAAARTAALAATTMEAALNPFATGRAAPDDVLRRIWSDTPRLNDGRKDQVSAFVRGPVAELPAGTLDVIVGVDRARDEYIALLPTSSFRNSRGSDALYGEIRAPLLSGSDQAGESRELAALTVAARRDRYDDFGAASTYQAGLELRPVQTLLLRASAATSFKPPTLLQTQVADNVLQLGLLGLVDPARGNERVTAGELIRTTNTGLQPETGSAWAIGGAYEPMPGTRASLTAWRVKIDSLIALLTPQAMLDNEALFGTVTRGPAVGGLPGVITQLRWAEVNFGRLDTTGVDLELAHAWQARGGRWSVSAAATRMTRYDVAIAPGQPEVSRLGQRFAEYWAPEWKGRASLGLDAGAWSVGWAARYIGAYRDSGASTRRLGDSWVHDLSGQLNLSRWGLNLPGARSSMLTVSLVNAADRQPQFAEASPFFDISQADWRGRTLSVRLSAGW